MNWPPFKLENFFAKHEFSARYLLCPSDSQPISLQELLSYADEDTKTLWSTLSLGYTEVPGHPLLRKEIAKTHPGCDPLKGIGVFTGAQEPILSFLHSFIQKGDHVVVPKPCYNSLSTIPEQLGAEVSTFPIRFSNGGWRFLLEDLENALRPNTRLIIINFPHNPTGVSLDLKTLEEIIALAKKSGAFLLSDEVYRFSTYSEDTVLPAAASLYEKAVSINCLSKSFGLPGLRIGWLASQDEDVVQKALEFKCYLSISNSGPSEILALMGLRAQKALTEKARGILRSNLSLLDRFFQKHHKLFAWKKPMAGTTAFVQLLPPIPVREFVEDLLYKEEVLLLPGPLLDYPGNFFRIGFGRKDFEQGLLRFEKYLDYKFSRECCY